jgi:hypothetical protein
MYGGKECDIPNMQQPNLGTLAKLPLELRQMIYFNLVDLRLSPVFSASIGAFWPQYFLQNELLLVSHQFAMELKQSTAVLSCTTRPNLVTRQVPLTWVQKILKIVEISRGYDLAWLETHEPTEAVRVPECVLSASIQSLQTMNASYAASKSNSCLYRKQPLLWFGDVTASEWQNLRKFLEPCLLRLRNHDQLCLHVLPRMSLRPESSVSPQKYEYTPGGQHEARLNFRYCTTFLKWAESSSNKGFTAEELINLREGRKEDDSLETEL